MHQNYFRVAVPLFIAICLLSFAADAADPVADEQAAPSFSCSGALTNVEKMICASPEISGLDREMSSRYQAGSASGAGKSARFQTTWLKQRNACRDEACITKLYQSHIADLEWLDDTDEDMDDAMNSVLSIAKNAEPLIVAQRAWEKELDRCADIDCMASAFAERKAALASQKATVLKAGVKTYRNEALGIAFDYLDNRRIIPCADTKNCIQLVGPAMAYGSSFLLQMTLVPGSLRQAADNIWEREGTSWIAPGRLGSRQAVEIVRQNGWQGMRAVVSCGVSDRLGFHGMGGECTSLLRSNGKQSVLIVDDGASGRDPSSLQTIESLRFLH